MHYQRMGRGSPNTTTYIGQHKINVPKLVSFSSACDAFLGRSQFGQAKPTSRQAPTLPMLAAPWNPLHRLAGECATNVIVQLIVEACYDFW
jgi:hypothetical protein